MNVVALVVDATVASVAMVLRDAAAMARARQRKQSRKGGTK